MNNIDIISSYFPEERLRDVGVLQKQIDEDEIIFQPDQILPYLQTIFFEEHLLECQLDQATQLFFTNILDDPQGLFYEHSDDHDSEREYQAGSYLLQKDYVLVNPLTPCMGNIRIRSCQKIVIRFFTGTKAIELGCTFRKKEFRGKDPVLVLNFPDIVRINREFRAYRVKVVYGVEAKVQVQKMNGAAGSKKMFLLEDISSMGMACQVPVEEKDSIEIDDNVRMKLIVSGIEDQEIDGTVRRIKKVRNGNGYKYICGVQFDLESRSLAAKIEQTAATVQRLQLRKVSERIGALEGVKIIK